MTGDHWREQKKGKEGIFAEVEPLEAQLGNQPLTLESLEENLKSVCLTKTEQKVHIRRRAENGFRVSLL